MIEENTYSFKAEQDNIMYDYSGEFNTMEKAIQWYFKHGIWLEKKFNRDLQFVQT